MCKVISLKALEKSIKSELSRADVRLPFDDLIDIKSFILYADVQILAGCSIKVANKFKRVYAFKHKGKDYTLEIHLNLQPTVYRFVLINSEIVHSWEHIPVYVKQTINSIDAKEINMDKILEDMIHTAEEKSLYSHEYYKNDLELIAKAIGGIKEAVYSAVSFLDGVVNDYIYQECSNVAILNENHCLVHYPFKYGDLKGLIVFDVVKNKEMGAVSYSLIYDGFICPLSEVLVTNI